MLADDLKQHYRPISPNELGVKSTVYNLLSKSTPDFVLEHDAADPRKALAFLYYRGKLLFDPRPGLQHVEIAQKFKLPHPEWLDPTTVQGRIGVMCGFPVVSVYPYYIKSVADLRHILSQLPIPPGALLTGIGPKFGVFRVSDITNVSTGVNVARPGQKWWAPTSETKHKLSEIIG